MYIADYTNIFMKICHAIAGFRSKISNPGWHGYRLLNWQHPVVVADPVLIQ